MEMKNQHTFCEELNQENSTVQVENFYYGMVLGLLQSRSNLLIQSNTELGESYSDISICTPYKVCVVIDLKYMDDGNLEKGCANTLLWIKT